MRRGRHAIWVCSMPVFVAMAAACSDDGGVLGGRDAADPCPRLERLADSAEVVESADLSDPEAFADALDAAVTQYLDRLADVREVVPDDLHADLDRLEAAVTQYDFDEAISARASLDEFARTACTTTTTVTGSGAG